ncbi:MULTISPECIES: cytochrome c oxidase assembly factor CtaG [Bacillus]|uniref:cytochrome c oxidase assembly factor CtaG n=1 Tax=Bacillus TaxID=1386 RepID=UPI001581A58E|nr:cytochrome c oxidase assembly factor CtaG [Bacillus glycinifermentans]MBU8786285.1 cytochrome c oxidase assembly factor CtaG [Bacillus glycinifermentans]NUJ18214.1 cytochrome c oxidase assembly factor CtaG [Bacillus glycinifermentans]
MGTLEIFGFRALWSPYFLGAVLFLTALYFVLIRRFGSDDERASRKEITLFLSGMVLLYVSKGSPLDLLGHIMFSAHMAQMAILYLVVPPLLILGVPAWFWKKAIFRPVVKPLFQFCSKPLIAIIVFNGLFSMYHIPLVFDFIKTNAVYHAAVTVLIFVAAFFMWWPLIHRVKELPHMNGLLKMGYIMADGILLTPACALIMFSDTALYSTYSDPSAWAEAMKLCVPLDMLSGMTLTGPEMFSSLPVIEDQQLGAIIMKIIQEIVYGTFLAIVFFSWAKKERAKDELEEPYSPSTVH